MTGNLLSTSLLVEASYQQAVGLTGRESRHQGQKIWHCIRCPKAIMANSSSTPQEVVSPAIFEQLQTKLDEDAQVREGLRDITQSMERQGILLPQSCGRFALLTFHQTGSQCQYFLRHTLSLKQNVSSNLRCVLRPRTNLCKQSGILSMKRGDLSANKLRLSPNWTA